MDGNKETKSEAMSWEKAMALVSDALKGNETLAFEMIKDSEKKAEHFKQLAEQQAERDQKKMDAQAEHFKKTIRNWVIAFLAILTAFFATNIYWIYIFQSYEYVYQDGEGINSINSGEQGDLLNGSESQNKEEREEQGNKEEKEKEVNE